MSQHILEIKSATQENFATIVVGFDRRLRESFWQIHAEGQEPVASISNPDISFQEAFFKFGLSDADLEKVGEQLDKASEAIYDEVVACDECAAVSELMNLIQEGYTPEKAQERINELKAFSDFNRIVNYGPVILTSK